MKLHFATACLGPCLSQAAMGELQAADSITLTLDRFDIGNDEGTMARSQIGEGAALIEMTRS